MSENNGFVGRDFFLFTQMKLHYHRFCDATDRLCKHVVLLLSNYQFWLGLNIFFGKCEKKVQSGGFREGRLGYSKDN